MFHLPATFFLSKYLKKQNIIKIPLAVELLNVLEEQMALKHPHPQIRRIQMDNPADQSENIFLNCTVEEKIYINDSFKVKERLYLMQFYSFTEIPVKHK